jgi:glucose-1-phosphate cytidylyltransferase
VILCGGRGQRAYPLTDAVPKPMLPVGGTPILVHVMGLFADYGHRDFVLSAGYRQEVIREYFDGHPCPGWHVDIVDTGHDAGTGDRLFGCRHLIHETFFVAYADGLSDVSLHALGARHAAHHGLVTVTAVPLACPFGVLDIGATGRVESFREKPLLREYWVSAGFFVMDRAILDHCAGASLEHDVLPGLASRGLVYAHRHDGFFKALDSYKDQQELEALLQSGRAPWRRGPGSPPGALTSGSE